MGLPKKIAYKDSQYRSITSAFEIVLRIDGESFPITLKLESENHDGSIKERAAASLIAAAEARGLLPGDYLIESSSGNLAKSLARICQEKGYNFVAVTDPKLSSETKQKLLEFGAITEEVINVDETGGYLLSRLAHVRKLLSVIPGSFWTDQYSNPANFMAHYHHTAPELFTQMKKRLDYVFIAVSTGGTLAGVSKYLRKYSPSTQIIAVDVKGSVALGGEAAPRLLNGIGSSRKSSFITPNNTYDEAIYVNDGEAFAVCNQLNKETGIMLGGSSGAAIAACAKFFRSNYPISGKRVACICPDKGENYASTIFDRKWLVSNGFQRLSMSPVDSFILPGDRSRLQIVNIY